MKSEIVRKIDELGRIVLPIEMRNALGWDEKAKISVTRAGDRLVLQSFQGSCFICGNENNIRPIHGKFVCQICINELNAET